MHTFTLQRPSRWEEEPRWLYFSIWLVILTTLQTSESSTVSGGINRRVTKKLIKSGRNLNIWDHEHETGLSENRFKAHKGPWNWGGGYHRTTRPVARLKQNSSHMISFKRVRIIVLKLDWTLEPPGEFLNLLMPRWNFKSIKTNSGNEIQASVLFKAP